VYALPKGKPSSILVDAGGGLRLGGGKAAAFSRVIRGSGALGGGGGGGTPVMIRGSGALDGGGGGGTPVIAVVAVGIAAGATVEPTTCESCALVAASKALVGGWRLCSCVQRRQRP